MRQPIEEASPVEIIERGHTCRVRLRFQVAPFGKLQQCSRNVIQPGLLTATCQFSQHFVGAKLQTVLPLGGGEYIHDRAIEHRLVCSKVAKERDGRG